MITRQDVLNNRSLLTEYRLTKTEFEVLSYAVEACPNKDIAAKLFVGEQAIRFHLTHIYKKLSVPSVSSRRSRKLFIHRVNEIFKAKGFFRVPRTY